MGIHYWLRRVGQGAVEDRILDGFELPGVVLGFDVDAHPAVVVFLASDERLGGVLGEVAIDDFPALLPSGHGVVFQRCENVPLIAYAQISKVAFALLLSRCVQRCLLAFISIFIALTRTESYVTAVVIAQKPRDGSTVAHRLPIREARCKRRIPTCVRLRLFCSWCSPMQAPPYVIGRSNLSGHVLVEVR
ncbi:hypothetical protein D3C75_583560 [compost metagenome]